MESCKNTLACIRLRATFSIVRECRPFPPYFANRFELAGACFIFRRTTWKRSLRPSLRMDKLLVDELYSRTPCTWPFRLSKPCKEEVNGANVETRTDQHRLWQFLNLVQGGQVFANLLHVQNSKSPAHAVCLLRPAPILAQELFSKTMSSAI